MSQTVHCRARALHPLRAVQTGVLALCLAPWLVDHALGQAPLPRPTTENTLQVFVLDPGLRDPALDSEAKGARARDIKRRLDPGGLYVRVGVALPYQPTGSEAYEAAQRARLPLALLGGPTTHHTHGWLSLSAVTTDLRNAQWLADGTLGRGAERERLWACPSPYAPPVHDARRAASAAMGGRVAELAARYPGVLGLVAGPLEHGLSTMGFPDLLADYSPWTIAQFRDWLTHRGLYGPEGSRAGQGWGEGEALADDPAPGDPAGGNASLNSRLSTQFGSWDLAYHDPAGSGPITESLGLLPRTGEPGYRSGGFDAPRSPNDPPALWEAWMEFRSELVRAWAEDHLADLRAELPGDVPLGSVVHLPPDQAWREAAACATIPRGGDVVLFDGAVADICAWVRERAVQGPWGAIVDVPYDPEPEDSAADWLGPLVAQGASVIVIRAWEENTGGYAALASSRLGPSVVPWLESLDDRPLGSAPGAVSVPPPVRGVAAEALAEGNRVSWSAHPFEGVPVRWEEWAPFAGYAVSRTHPEPLLLGTTRNASFLDPTAPPDAQYAVRALVR